MSVGKDRRSTPGATDVRRNGARRTPVGEIISTPPETVVLAVAAVGNWETTLGGRQDGQVPPTRVAKEPKPRMAGQRADDHDISRECH